MNNEKTKFIYWHSGDPLPSELPDGCEYYHHVAWVEAFDIPSNHPTEWISEPRRWPATEAGAKAWHWCLAHGCSVPDTHEVVGFGYEAKYGECFLSCTGMLLSNSEYVGEPKPILRKKEIPITWVKPTDEDVVRCGRLKCQVKDNNNTDWVDMELLKVKPKGYYNMYLAINDAGDHKPFYKCRVDARLLKGDADA